MMHRALLVIVLLITVSAPSIVLAALLGEPCTNSDQCTVLHTTCKKVGNVRICVCVPGHFKSGDECLPSVPVDGAWTLWTNWGCSVTCGTGTATRSRTCTNPPPQNGGADCPGESTQTGVCTAGGCPVDGVWTLWTNWACSVTCGTGTETRTRTCTNPPAQNGGADCHGESTQTGVCTAGGCPGNCIYGFWGPYFRLAGTVCRSVRHRSSVPFNCPFKTQYTSCIDGGWSIWSAWDCHVTCGSGIASRSRTCSNPTPQNGGANCNGVASKTEVCTRAECSGILECPVCGLNEHCESARCVCNHGYTRGADRSCVLGTGCTYGDWLPYVRLTGTLCRSVRYRSSIPFNCPLKTQHASCIDGGWSLWSASRCHVTCGSGTASRSRTCSNPPPHNGGANCNGVVSQIEPCTLAGCSGTVCTYGSWGPYVRLTVGVCIAVRHRSSVPFACPLKTQHTSCIDGGWLSWSAWICHVTCGSGTASRRRTCSNPRPQNGGANCNGVDRQAELCTRAACSGMECPPCGINEHCERPICVCNTGYGRRGDGYCVSGMECPPCGINEHCERPICVCNTGYGRRGDGYCVSGTVCTYGPWGAYVRRRGTACISTRHRSSEPFNCPLKTQQALCVDCVVGPWFGWDVFKITPTCYELNSRHIIRPPFKGGYACPILKDRRRCVGRGVGCVMSGWGHWVYFASTTCYWYRVRRILTHPANGGAPCPTSKDTITATCGCAADVVFLVDLSGSIGATDWSQLQQFIVNIINRLAISSSQVRVGMVTFTHAVQNEFFLNAYTTNDDVIAHVNSVQNRAGGTFTDIALKFVRENSFQEANGDRLDRPNVLIVVTDGFANAGHDPKQEARLLHQAGVKVISVGVGIGSNIAQLQSIASTTANVYAVPAISVLQFIENKIEVGACPA